MDYKLQGLTFPSNHWCQTHILAGERPRTLVILCCFLFLKQERVHINIFLYKNLCMETSQ